MSSESTLGQKLADAVKWLYQNRVSESVGYGSIGADKYAKYKIKVIGELQHMGERDFEETKSILLKSIPDGDLRELLIKAITPKLVVFGTNKLNSEEIIDKWRKAILLPRDMTPEQISIVKDYCKGTIRW